MKKFIALLLALAMVFSMCACAASDDSSDTKEPADAAQTSDDTQTPDDGGDAAEPDDAQPSDDAETPDASGTRVITDMLGREVEIPETVTSYAANSNEPYLLSYAGAVDGYLTGYRETDASQELLYPGITKFDYICFTDGGGTVDQEALIECDPDIVLLRTNDPEDERIAQIESCGLPVVCCFPPNSEGVMDFYRLAAEIFGGEIADNCENLINTYYDALKIYDDYNTLEGVRVLALWSMGNGTYRLQGNTAETVECIKRTGATMCYDEPDYIEVDMEAVAAYDADVIINFRSKEVADTELVTNPVFTNTRAYQDGKFYTVMCDFGGWAPSTFPSIIMLMYWMCSTLYGEDYTGPAMEDVVRDFGLEWCHYEATDAEIATMLEGTPITLNEAQFVK